MGATGRGGILTSRPDHHILRVHIIPTYGVYKLDDTQRIKLQIVKYSCVSEYKDDCNRDSNMLASRLRRTSWKQLMLVSCGVKCWHQIS